MQVSFQWKNPDFLLKNPDFLLKNVDFTLCSRADQLHATAGGGEGAGEALPRGSALSDVFDAPF